MIDRDAAARAEYLPEEEEGEVEERATFRSRPGQRLHGPVAAVLALSDLRLTLSSTMNLHYARPAIPLRPPFRDPSEGYERKSSSKASASNKGRQYRTLHHARSPSGLCRARAQARS